MDKDSTSTQKLSPETMRKMTDDIGLYVKSLPEKANALKDDEEIRRRVDTALKIGLPTAAIIGALVYGFNHTKREESELFVQLRNILSRYSKE